MANMAPTAAAIAARSRNTRPIALPPSTLAAVMVPMDLSAQGLQGAVQEALNRPLAAAHNAADLGVAEAVHVLEEDELLALLGQARHRPLHRLQLLGRGHRGRDILGAA